MIVTDGGLTVQSGGLHTTGSQRFTGGLTVESGGASIYGGLTAATAGLVVVTVE